MSLCQYHLGAPPHKSTSGGLLTGRKQLPHADDAAKAGRPDDMKEARKTSKLGTDSVALETGDSFGFSRLSPEDTDFKMPPRTPQDQDAMEQHVDHHNSPCPGRTESPNRACHLQSVQARNPVRAGVVATTPRTASFPPPVTQPHHQFDDEKLRSPGRGKLGVHDENLAANLVKAESSGQVDHPTIRN